MSPTQEGSHTADSRRESPSHIKSEHQGAETLKALSRDEFCARFKARMLAVAGAAFDDGDSIAEYADEAGPTYWDDLDQRSDGPEACADADMSYWGD